MTKARRRGPGGRAAWLVLCACCAGTAQPAALRAQTWRTVTAARVLHGEPDMTASIEYGAGRFHLAPGRPDELYRLSLRYDEDAFTPLREYDPESRTLRFGVRGRAGWHGSTRSPDSQASFDLALSPAVPWTLNLALGAVRTDVDLGGLSLRSFSLKTGASESRLRFGAPNPAACDAMSLEAGAAEFDAEQLGNANCARLSFKGGVGDVTLDFGGTWRRPMRADVTVGVGSLRLRLPRDLGVAVHLNRFLASFDAAGFDKQGDTYTSPNFATARYRLTLDVHASIGGVVVEWIRP